MQVVLTLIQVQPFKQRIHISDESQKNFIEVSSTNTGNQTYNNVTFAIQNYPSFGRTYEDTFLFEMYDSTSYVFGTEMALNGGEWHANTTVSGSGNQGWLRLRDTFSGQSDIDIQGNDIRIGTFGGNFANTTLQIGRDSQSTTDMKGGVLFSGQASGGDLTTFDDGNKIIISGSVSTRVDPLTITSNTASIDFSDAGLFEITLVSGSTTHLVPTNAEKGQTINVLITQPGTGTGSVEFSNEFLQPTGSLYIPTAETNAQDIITLLTFNDTNKCFVSNVVNFTDSQY